MDAERAARFADKLEHATERLEQFQTWSDDAADDVKSRLAAYKAFQEAAEALLDVVAMVVKEQGHTPKDDYTNIGQAEGDSTLSASSASALREANGLRNRLVHEYNGLTDDVALESGVRLSAELLTAI